MTTKFNSEKDIKLLSEALSGLLDLQIWINCSMRSIMRYDFVYELGDEYRAYKQVQYLDQCVFGKSLHWLSEDVSKSFNTTKFLNKGVEFISRREICKSKNFLI